MTAVAVELLTRPPEVADVWETATPAALAPDAVEFVSDTDTLLTRSARAARAAAILLRLGHPRGLTGIRYLPDPRWT